MTVFDDQVSEAVDNREPVLELFSKLKRALPQLEALLAECNSQWLYEDMVYRFYTKSFKVYYLQDATSRIGQALHQLSPRPLNEWFMQIVNEGMGKRFDEPHNEKWPEVTRPILEAFFHARYFLEVAVRYGRELEFPPRLMPSGWAAYLHLYDLR